jgi:glycosyltransferase involved in cell wall biosynthesis
MRILYHHRTSARDGSAVHIDGLVEALRGQGHEVIVVAPPVAANGAKRTATRLDGLRRRLPRAVHELLELAYNLPEAVRLARALRRHRPDLVYERSNLYLVAAALLAPRYRVPRITEVNAPFFLERSRHGGLALPGLARWTEEFAWRRADAVVAVTGVLAGIVERAGVPRDRTHVMSNGIDATALAPGPASGSARDRLGWRDRTILGFTGYVREWNGLDGAVDLLAAPGNESFALLVVGDGTARAAVEARAARLGVGDRLHFTGLVGRAEVPYWVGSFDIALQPAANPYASPLKLFEYMAMRRAIVAPDQPNIREVLQHETNALLFTPDDPRSFAAAVRRLALDSALRARLGHAAAGTIERRNMTWANNARRVAELAERLRQAGAQAPAGQPARSISAR